MAGVDLLDDAAVKARPAIFGECFTHNAVDLNDPASSLRWRWVIDGQLEADRAARARTSRTRSRSCTTCRSDPHEQTNLAGQDPQRVEALTRQLDAWWSPRMTCVRRTSPD